MSNTDTHHQDYNLHLTVAAVIEYNDKFLLVTDNTTDGHKLNQPAGHVEYGENIISAIMREVKEETNLDFIPHKVIGIYLYTKNIAQNYLRICFKGSITGNMAYVHPSETDDGVISANWYSLKQINGLSANQLRSPLVKQCITDYLANIEFDLSIIRPYQDL